MYTHVLNNMFQQFSKLSLIPYHTIFFYYSQHCTHPVLCINLVRNLFLCFALLCFTNYSYFLPPRTKQSLQRYCIILLFSFISLFLPSVIKNLLILYTLVLLILQLYVYFVTYNILPYIPFAVYECIKHGEFLKMLKQYLMLYT